VAVFTLCAPHRHTVYPIFAEAARRWAAGQDLYLSVGEPYRYSPGVAAFFVPFSRLPDGPGGLFWRLLGAGLFLGGLAWWGRDAFRPRPANRHALLFLLAAPLAVGNVHNGQANVLVIGLLLVAVAAVRRERFTLAAAALAVAVLFKLYPIALGLLLVALHPRRLGPRLALALAAGLLLPFLLQRPGYVAAQYAGWLGHLEANDRQLLPRDLWYRDLRQLCSLWLTPLSYRAYQALEVLSGAGLALLALGLRWAGVPPTRLLALVLGLACCWMTVLGPATESATYVLLAPPAAWLTVSAGARGDPPWLRGLFLGGYGLLLAAQLAVTTPWGRTFHALGSQPLGGLLLLAGLLAACFREAVARPPAERPLAGAPPQTVGAPLPRPGRNSADHLAKHLANLGQMVLGRNSFLFR
jgi:hypothetical protein